MDCVTRDLVMGYLHIKGLDWMMSQKVVIEWCCSRRPWHSTSVAMTMPRLASLLWIVHECVSPGYVREWAMMKASSHCHAPTHRTTASGEMSGVWGQRNTRAHGELGTDNGVSRRAWWRLPDAVNTLYDGLKIGQRMGIKKRNGTPRGAYVSCLRHLALPSQWSRKNIAREKNCRVSLSRLNDSFTSALSLSSCSLTSWSIAIVEDGAHKHWRHSKHPWFCHCKHPPPVSGMTGIGLGIRDCLCAEFAGLGGCGSSRCEE